MKWILIILGLLLTSGVILFLLNPMLALVSSGPAIQVEVETTKEENGYRNFLRLVNTDQKRYLTEFNIERVNAEAINLEPPDGFEIEPLPHNGSDKEWTDDWNKENIRFTGNLALLPNETVEFFIPCNIGNQTNASLQCTYETKKTFGNMMSFFKIELKAEQDGSGNPDKPDPRP